MLNLVCKNSFLAWIPCGKLPTVSQTCYKTFFFRHMSSADVSGFHGAKDFKRPMGECLQRAFVNVTPSGKNAYSQESDSTNWLKTFLAAGLAGVFVGSTAVQAGNSSSSENERNEPIEIYTFPPKTLVSHGAFLYLGTALGYEGFGRGACYGISMRGMEAFLLGEKGLVEFDTRLEKVHLLAQKNRWRMFCWLFCLFTVGDIGFGRSPEYIKQLANSIDPDLYNDLQAFFDSVSIYQLSPFGKMSLFSFTEEIFSIASSVEIIQKGGLCEIGKFSGLYNVEELESYLYSLKTAIESSNSFDGPIIALQIGTNCHSISIGYDSLNKTWFFCDANNLSAKAKTVKLAAKLIFYMLTLSRSENVAMSTTVFSVASSKKPAQGIWDKWRKSVDFKNIHEVTLEKTLFSIRGFNGRLYDWFYMACFVKDIEGAIKILKMIPDLNKELSGGGTPLMLASLFGFTEVVKFLLEAKVDVDLVASNEYTPLMCACLEGQAEVVKLLLEAKANVDLTTFNGSALLVAQRNNHSEVVKLLLAAGAK